MSCTFFSADNHIKSLTKITYQCLLFLFIFLFLAITPASAAKYRAELFTVRYNFDVVGIYVIYWLQSDESSSREPDPATTNIVFFPDPRVDLTSFFNNFPVEGFNVERCLTEEKQWEIAPQGSSVESLSYALIPGSQSLPKTRFAHSEPLPNRHAQVVLYPFKFEAPWFLITLSTPDASRLIEIMPMMEMISEEPFLQPPTIGNYRILRVLGFSHTEPLQIVEGVSPDHQHVAIERWKVSGPQDIERRKKQVDVMTQLSRHSNNYSVQLIESFQSGDYFFIVEEIAEKSLTCFLEKCPDVNERYALFALTNVLRILSFLDKAGFIHEFNDYDWLLSGLDKPKQSLKFCGHERTTPSEGTFNSVSEALDSLSSTKLISFFYFHYTGEDPFSKEQQRLKDLLTSIHNYKAPAELYLSLLSDPGYQADVDISALPGSLLSHYQVQLFLVLLGSGLTVLPTPGDGSCLLHAVLQPLNISINTALAELPNHIPTDSTFQYLAHMELQDHHLWNSPALLPLLASWTQRLIVLLMPNSETGDLMIQVFTPEGFDPEVGSLQEAIEVSNNTAIVIFHNGIDHFSATTAISSSVDEPEPIEEPESVSTGTAQTSTYDSQNFSLAQALMLFLIFYGEQFSKGTL